MIHDPNSFRILSIPHLPSHISHFPFPTMPSTHTSLHCHFVFSTKNRQLWFTADHCVRLHAYMGGILRGLDAVAHAVGGVADHVHLLVGLKPVHRLSDVMRELKSESSGWIHRELRLTGFAWQEGYGAFSVGAPELEVARAYVLNQEAHHRKKTFQEEYLMMLQRGLVGYDDRYLW